MDKQELIIMNLQKILEAYVTIIELRGGKSITSFEYAKMFFSDGNPICVFLGHRNGPKGMLVGDITNPKIGTYHFTGRALLLSNGTPRSSFQANAVAGEMIWTDDKRLVGIVCAKQPDTGRILAIPAWGLT